jgi:hypothetical protein
MPFGPYFLGVLLRIDPSSLILHQLLHNQYSRFAHDAPYIV